MGRFAGGVSRHHGAVVAGQPCGLGRPQDAVALGEALVRVAPDSYPAWRVLGEASAIRGERERAVECLRKALSVNTRGLAARTMLARLGEKP